MKDNIFDLLTAKANVKINQGLMTLRGFSENFAAIGDHTTGDLYDNLSEALQDYMDGRDELEAVEQLRKIL